MRRPPSSRRRMLGLALVAALFGLVLKASDPGDNGAPVAARVAHASPPHATPPEAVPPRAIDEGDAFSEPAPLVLSGDDGDDPSDGASPQAANDGGWFAAPSPSPSGAGLLPLMMPAAGRPRAGRAEAPHVRVERPDRAPSEKRLRRKHRRPARNQSAADAQSVRAPRPMPHDGMPEPVLRVEAPTLPASSATTAGTAPPPDDVAVRTGDDVQFPTGDQVAIPLDDKVGQDAGSVSLWVQPGWEPGDDDPATLVEVGDGLRLTKDAGTLRLEAGDGGAADDDGPADLGTPIAHWNRGEWHHVAASWNGNQLSLYVDGELVGRRMGHGPFDVRGDGALRIGSDHADDRPVAPGLIGRIDVRNRPLDDDEVARDYHDSIDAGHGTERGPDGDRSDGHGMRPLDHGPDVEHGGGEDRSHAHVDRGRGR